VDNLRARRIIADHLRASVFLIGDGVLPGNKDQGYVLRRLLRRSVRYADTLGMKHGSLFWIADTVVQTYQDAYPLLITQKAYIKGEIDKEEQKFRKALGPDSRGMKELEKAIETTAGDKVISGEASWDIYQSFGIPLEMMSEIAHEKGASIDTEAFQSLLLKHQEASRSGAEQKFKGGLSGTGEMETRYHTATHLLNAALREILGTHVSQKGSNITAERMRFDFAHPQKLTDEERKRVEDLVNLKIREAHPVTFREMPKEEAEKLGAVHAFGDKYGNIVKVYSIGNEQDGYFSREFCGGPHVANTSELGHFAIAKEEAVSQGVRRIKAVLTNI
jgi:alanyl-tRNA synthetase